MFMFICLPGNSKCEAVLVYCFHGSSSHTRTPAFRGTPNIGTSVIQALRPAHSRSQLRQGAPCVLINRQLFGYN